MISLLVFLVVMVGFDEFSQGCWAWLVVGVVQGRVCTGFTDGVWGYRGAGE